MTEAPEKIWAGNDGYANRWDWDTPNDWPEYTRSDIAQARIDNLHQIWVYRDLTQADFDKAFKD
jgi:hypothetical protein